MCAATTSGRFALLGGVEPSFDMLVQAAAHARQLAGETEQHQQQHHHYHHHQQVVKEEKEKGEEEKEEEELQWCVVGMLRSVLSSSMEEEEEEEKEKGHQLQLLERGVEDSCSQYDDAELSLLRFEEEGCFWNSPSSCSPSPTSCAYASACSLAYSPSGSSCSSSSSSSSCASSPDVSPAASVIVRRRPLLRPSLGSSPPSVGSPIPAQAPGPASPSPSYLQLQHGPHDHQLMGAAVGSGSVIDSSSPSFEPRRKLVFSPDTLITAGKAQGPENVALNSRTNKGATSIKSSTTALHATGPGANPNYKTELCRTFQEKGSCPYGHKCQFAHGTQELRVTHRNMSYKTSPCRFFHENGYCQFGVRCSFLHHPKRLELGKLAECNLAEIRRSSRNRLPIFEELSPSARTLQLRTLEKHRRSHQSNDASRAMKEISKFVRQRDRSRGKPTVGDVASSK